MFGNRPRLYGQHRSGKSLIAAVHREIRSRIGLVDAVGPENISEYLGRETNLGGIGASRAGRFEQAPWSEPRSELIERQCRFRFDQRLATVFVNPERGLRIPRPVSRDEIASEAGGIGERPPPAYDPVQIF